MLYGDTIIFNTYDYPYHYYIYAIDSYDNIMREVDMQFLEIVDNKYICYYNKTIAQLILGKDGKLKQVGNYSDLEEDDKQIVKEMIINGIQNR